MGMEYLAPLALKQLCVEGFANFDANGDGELDESEVQQVLESLGSRLPPMMFGELQTALKAISVQEMIVILDTDKNGTLSKRELLAVVPKLLEWGRNPRSCPRELLRGLAPAALRASCDAIFDRFDSDKNGELDRSEARQMLQSLKNELPSLGATPEQQQLLISVSEIEMMKEMDTDNSGTLSKMEFKAWVDELLGGRAHRKKAGKSSRR